MKKFIVSVNIPRDYSEKLMDALDKVIDFGLKYHRVFSISETTGTWIPTKSSSPFIGEEGKISEVQEHKIEFVVYEKDLNAVAETIRKVHPYEEPAVSIVETKDWKTFL